MSQFYNEDSFWVDDADLFETKEEFVIDEEEAKVEEPMVVEEDEEPAPQFTRDFIPGSEIEYVEEEDAVEDKETSWADDGDHSKFVAYLHEKIKSVPRHSGQTIPGNERAKAYLKSLDNEISKAMRTDLEGKIDEQQVDAIRSEIENMIERLELQIKKLRGPKRADLDIKLFAQGSCEKCGSSAPMWEDIDNGRRVCMHCEAGYANETDGLEKKAGTPTLQVYMSPFERAIVGIIVNSVVSAGRNVEETYEKLKNKYAFTPREELAIQQLVSDYGYPVYKDRGLLNEPSDPASGDGVEWQTNYQA